MKRSVRPFLFGLAGVLPLWALALSTLPLEPHVAPARDREAWTPRAKATIAKRGLGSVAVNAPAPNTTGARPALSGAPDPAFGALGGRPAARPPGLPRPGFAEVVIPRDNLPAEALAPRRLTPSEPVREAVLAAAVAEPTPQKASPAPVAATALPQKPEPAPPVASVVATPAQPPVQEAPFITFAAPVATTIAPPTPAPPGEAAFVSPIPAEPVPAPRAATSLAHSAASPAPAPPPVVVAALTPLMPEPAAEAASPAEATALAYAPVPAARKPTGPVDPAPQAPVQTPEAAAAAAPAPDARDEIIAADTTGVRPAIALYARGDTAAGDRLAKTLDDPVARALLEYVALRFNYRELGYERVMAFRDANADWPTAGWLARRGEELLYNSHAPAKKVAAHFTGHDPETHQGKLALARTLAESGERSKAAALVRDVWREADLTAPFEQSLRDSNADFINNDDIRYRASRFLFKENTSAGLRLAALAGPDYLAVAKARAAVINEDPGADAAFQAVPAALRNDPGLIFSRIQHLRRAERVREAAEMMLAAPRDPTVLVNGDEWWVERRLIARELLDVNDAASAYLVAQGHGATSPGMKVEAEFHAGWIALRFLNDPSTASHHFSKAAAAAETSMSISRANYWLGRAAEAAGDMQKANDCFEKAAAHGANYYGQLAQNKLGRSTLNLREPAPAAQGDARAIAVRVIEMLYALGETAQANALAYEAAQKLTAEPQLAALSAVIARQKNASLMLGVGKVVTQRGLPFDAMAFPTFGVPAYQPLDNSAEKAMVYSIARQESAFQANAESKAGAKGLMQMLVSTAARTAQRKGVAFDAGRLLRDPAYNAQLGAAHLGELLEEQDGSYILTFAAYNAGGKRVSEWIAAYGDPRKPGVDPVDWVERIPITETRNYVQRIVENMQVYRYRLGNQTTLLIDQDLRRTR